MFPVLSAFSAFLAIPTTNPPCSANRGRKELQFKKKLKLNKNWGSYDCFCRRKNVKRITNWILPTFSAESFNSFSWILKQFQMQIIQEFQLKIIREFQLNPSRVSAENIRFLHGLVIVNARGMKLKTFLSQKLLKVFFRTTFKPQVHEL